MAWETRNGRSYYYAKVRVGTKVKSVYLGTCPEAFIEANRIEHRTQEEQAWQELESQLQQLKTQTEHELKKAGLHRQNYGPWRNQMPKQSAKP